MELDSFSLPDIYTDSPECNTVQILNVHTAMERVLPDNNVIGFNYDVNGLIDNFIIIHLQ